MEKEGSGDKGERRKGGEWKGRYRGENKRGRRGELQLVIPARDMLRGGMQHSPGDGVKGLERRTFAIAWSFCVPMMRW